MSRDAGGVRRELIVGSWALTAAGSSVAEAIISRVFATAPPAFNGMVLLS
jgi:hypothetical protein